MKPIKVKPENMAKKKEFGIILRFKALPVLRVVVVVSVALVTRVVILSVTPSESGIFII